MSADGSIAVVTTALRARLDRGLNAALAGTLVTCRPPDRARIQASGNQVNLYLFQATLNTAWRNVAVDGAAAPLGLNLYYLLSVYGANDDDPDPVGHQLLGAAMRLLHDEPVLSVDELDASASGHATHAQPERIRITPHPMSVEELTKLWTIFQTPYRLSVAYEVSPVLIGASAPDRSRA